MYTERESKWNNVEVILFPNIIPNIKKHTTYYIRSS